MVTFEPGNCLRLPDLPKNLFDILNKASSKAGISRVALVGGAVRDLCFHIFFNGPLPELQDLDFIVEGSASRLAKEIKNYIDHCRLSKWKIYKDFDTVEMKIDGVAVDIATSRRETYSVLGENPAISPCSIEKDLARRDFTVNAIAIDISDLTLIDPYNGIKDLKEKKLNFLSKMSVSQDPTRVIRGARYAARLNFDLSTEALNQVKSTIQDWPWSWHFKDNESLVPTSLSTRLRLELTLLIEKEPIWEALNHLNNWGAFSLIDKKFCFKRSYRRKLSWATKLKANRLIALILLFENPELVGKRLKVTLKEQKLISEAITIENFLKQKNINDECSKWTPLKWCQEIESKNWSTEAIALAISIGVPEWKSLLRWLGHWRLIKSPISGKDLIASGWQPGPLLGAELKRLREVQLKQIMKRN